MKTRMLLAAFAAASFAFAAPAAAQKTLKYAHFQPAKEDQPKHAAALAFKEHVERATNGSIKVEIFPAGQFGKDQPTMEAVKMGTLEMAVAHDGAIATVYRPAGVLGIPFLYENHEHAWRVYDSDWLKGFSDDMVKKQGIRLLGLADNGVRHFTNSLRPIKSPADMQGMKIRIQPSPVFKILVESLGASPSAIPWAELPAALQQKVVDGQENGVTNILAASLYQHQKYVTLDGHVWSVHGYLINERFYQGLTPTERAAVDEGTKKAIAIHRKMTADQDRNARPHPGETRHAGHRVDAGAGRRVPQALATAGSVLGREGDRQGVRRQPVPGDREDHQTVSDGSQPAREREQAMTRDEIVARLPAQRVLPVLRLSGAQETLDAVGCLHEAGFRVFEITMTTPGAEALVGRIVRERPDSLVGAGTVVDVPSADACLAQGAAFLVTPYPVRGVAARCRAMQRAALIGAFTPAEVAVALEEGADFVKVFPASTGGPAHVAALKSIFPDIRLCPTGGIDHERIAAYLKAGAAMVGAGSRLVDRDALARADRDAVVANARRYLQLGA